MLELDDDPLGIGLQTRAAARRKAAENSQPTSEWMNHQIGGPAISPAWEGWFQALQEAGVDNLGDNSVGVKRGMWSQGPEYKPLFDPNYGESSAVAQAIPTLSGAADTPGFNIQRDPSTSIMDSPALSGLKRAKKGY